MNDARPPVRSETQGGVATLTLDRPEALNAFTSPLMGALHDALEAAAADETVRCVVLAGAGRAFCAGADLAGVPAPGDDAALADSAAVMGADYHPAIRRLATMPVPTLARIHGAVAGGGLGLALGCDLSIAGHSAFFACTFAARLGIAPDLGTSWHLPRRSGRARALGMALLGDRISAEQAADWGLIWRAVPDGELDAAVADTAARLARLSGETVRHTRALLDTAADRSLPEQLEAEGEAQRVLVPRNMLRAAEAFLARKEPEFER